LTGALELLELRRQAFHFIIGAAIAIFVHLAPRNISVPVLVVASASVFIMRKAYRHVPPLNWLIETFERTEDSASGKQFKGAFYLALGSALAAGLFPPFEASLGILVLSVSDSLPTVIGKTYGKRKIHLNKTVEGTLAFFISASAILLYFFQPHIAILTALTATLLELYSPIDDNLVLPPAVAFLLTKL